MPRRHAGDVRVVRRKRKRSHRRAMRTAYRRGRMERRRMRLRLSNWRRRSPRRNPRRLKKTHRGHRFKNSYPGILPRRRSLRLRLRRPRRARVPGLSHRDFLSRRHYFHPPLRNPARIQSRTPRVQPIQLASIIFSVSTTTRRKWTKLRRRRRPSPIPRKTTTQPLKVCLKMVLGTKKNQVRVNWERMTT